MWPRFSIACSSPICRPSSGGVYRYLALLWVSGFAPTPEDGFEVLMTHDPAQLAGLKDHNWRPYFERARNAPRVLAAHAEQINAAIRLQRAGETKIVSADLIDVVATEAFEAPCLGRHQPTDQRARRIRGRRPAAAQPDRQSLGAAVDVPGEQGRILAPARLRAGLRALPAGALAIVWGGDGALSWRECLATWSDYGTAAHVRRTGPGDGAPGWAIIRRG